MILVTLSHHRVSHATNPEYIDKIIPQIFIVWDRVPSRRIRTRTGSFLA
jgi:hypothetical protein